MQNRIKELRIQNGMYQEKLARLVNSSQQTISKIENNKMTPPADIVVDIAKVFDKTVDYILGLTDEPEYLKGNDRLASLAREHYQLLNLLTLMTQEDVYNIYLFAKTLSDKNNQDK